MTALFALGDDQKNTGSGNKGRTGHVQYRKHRYFSLVWILFDPALVSNIWYLVLAHPYLELKLKLMAKAELNGEIYRVTTEYPATRTNFCVAGYAVRSD